MTRLSRNKYLLLGLSGISLLLSGCSVLSTSNFNGGGASQPSSTSPVWVSGKLMGGRQAIYNATVTLYAMNSSTSTYGDTPTQLAQVNTGVDGTFLFVKGVDGVASSVSGAGWSCPANASTGAAGSADNPMLYLVASGGDTSGSITAGNVGSAYNNTASKLFAVLGACNSVNALSLVRINEGISAATMVALQQFFNPSNEAFGTASTNITGLVNAVANVNMLADQTTGVIRSSFTPSSSVPGITMSGTSEYTKLNTIANILASCVSSTSASSANCVSLFTNAVPPADSLAPYTNHPALSSFPAASDTMLAVYYMNINPTESQDYSSPTGKLGNLYALQNQATAPFAPFLTTQPMDWTVGVSFSASGTCTSATPNGSTYPNFTTGTYGMAIDANGNAWFGSSGSAPNPLVQVGPQGQALNCVSVGNQSAGRRVAIDSRGNVWYGVTYNNGSTSYSLLEYVTDSANPAVGTFLIWPTTYKPSGLAADASGNIYFAADAAISSAVGPIFEFANAATASTAGTTSDIISLGSALSASPVPYRELVVTSTGVFTVGTGAARYMYRYDFGTQTTSRLTFDNSAWSTPYGLSQIPSGAIVGGNTATARAGGLYRLDRDAGTLIDYSPNYAGGSPATRGLATDGAGNIWTGSGTYYADVNSTELPMAGVYGDSNYTGISPQGVTPATCGGSSCQTLGGFQKYFTTATDYAVAVDASGNVWGAQDVTTSSTVAPTFYYIVGVGVPVIGPLYKNIH